MLRWMALVGDEREGAFSTWPWERVRCACSSSPTARFLRGTATTVSLTSTRCFGRVACPQLRTWCGARPESASIEAFAVDFRCVSTDAFGPGTTQRTRLSSRALLWGAAIPVLVDPSNSSIVYTLRDVEHGTNAGTSPVFWYGVVLVVLGLAGFAFLLRLRRPTMPRPRWPNRSPG